MFATSKALLSSSRQHSISSLSVEFIFIKMPLVCTLVQLYTHNLTFIRLQSVAVVLFAMRLLHTVRCNDEERFFLFYYLNVFSGAFQVISGTPVKRPKSCGMEFLFSREGSLSFGGILLWVNYWSYPD